MPMHDPLDCDGLLDYCMVNTAMGQALAAKDAICRGVSSFIAAHADVSPM